MSKEKIVRDSVTEDVEYEVNDALLYEEEEENSDTETEVEVPETSYTPPRRGKPVQFPTTKPGHYSKDRRHVPKPKKSDEAKNQVRAKGGKGKNRKNNPLLNEDY